MEDNPSRFPCALSRTYSSLNVLHPDAAPPSCVHSSPQEPPGSQVTLLLLPHPVEGPACPPYIPPPNLRNPDALPLRPPECRLGWSPNTHNPQHLLIYHTQWKPAPSPGHGLSQRLSEVVWIPTAFPAVAWTMGVDILSMFLDYSPSFLPKHQP